MGDAEPVVVVTGAAGGIGTAIVAELLAAGTRVVGVDRETVELAGVTAVKADLTDPHGPEAVVAAVTAYGRLDGLVNNAAISRRAPLGELADETLAAVLDTNLSAALRLTRALLPFLGAGAAVVNVSSIRAGRGFAGDTAYIASKGGLEAATRALAVELAPRGVRVNAVAPGAIETDLNRAVLADPGHRQRVLGRIPLGRIGRPGDVAPAVSFLLGEQARWITGAVLTVDGGQTALG